MAKMCGKKLAIGSVMGVSAVLVITGGIILWNTALSGASEERKPANTVEGSAASGVAVGEAIPMQPTHVSCNFQNWLGKTAEEAEAAAKATGRPYRILPPGSAMTMDYRADRINVETDGAGEGAKVVKIGCG